ncbi:MAG TPA: YciI family protein [Steroidobacteraceae bacterium]|nr:YciI family protein [Steroidobacteraceae bacterium]
MQFMVECQDKPGYLQLRLDTRPPHLEYLLGHSDRIVLAGPLLDATGQPNGSLLVFDVANRSELDQIIQNDPYALAGLFASVRVKPFRKTLPATS